MASAVLLPLFSSLQFYAGAGSQLALSMTANPIKIMPRPSFPPTPQPSTDIIGKSSTDAPRLESSFTLPPAALSSRRSASSSSEPSENASDSSYHPLSPASPVAKSKPSHARKRSNASAQQAITTKDDYSLPPPPTRSRKIIQMKPKEMREAPKAQHQVQDVKMTSDAATNGTKRKQAGNATAAGRKIARKTAHSLIERRRRSKMNEEFGVLKDMIPACKGQEMHKLAILQASIEYMRYLEQCIGDLKNAHQSQRDSPPLSNFEHSLRPVHEDREEREASHDEEMEDAVSPTKGDAPYRFTFQSTNTSPTMCASEGHLLSPAIVSHDPGHYSAKPSPVLQGSDARHYSLASSSVRSAITSPSMQPSPVFSALPASATQFNDPFGAGLANDGCTVRPGLSQAAKPFALTSPALGPQTDREDQEATEALMMLNTDRRSWSSARGMSVKDLLSG